MKAKPMGLAGRGRWYLERLRSMPPAEIPHRIVEALRRRADRGGSYAARHGAAPAAVRTGPVPAFPTDRTALLGASAADRQRIAQQARDILGGRLELLGQAWPEGSRTDWSLDPVSGNRWEWDKFCFDIDRRHGRGPGDVKFVWELSRLQHLQILALDACLSGNPASREACLGDLAAWIAANPPYRGLGYACGIELASRVVSLLVIAGLLGPDTVDGELRGTWWDSLHAHGHWLARYPSLHSSANNHLVAEAAGLFALGCLAPQLPAAPAWLAMGREHLEREAARQIHADGVGAEQSPSYQAYTMEWLLLAHHIALASGHRLAAVVDQRLRAGAAFLAALLDQAGNHPRFGDEDEGVVLRQQLAAERLPLAIAGAVGAVFGDGSLCHPAYSLDWRARLLGASALPPSSWRPASATFLEGGYTSLRAGSAMALFDHGPLGFAHTAGHGHADALSVWLHLGGTPMLVDAGTYRYNHDSGWRDHLRSTLAHNTVTLDRLNQSEPTGPFNWGGRRARARLTEARLDAPAPQATASHDGYQAFGLGHERTVTLTETELTITDHISGMGRHHVSLALQFAPNFSASTGGGGAARLSSATGPGATVRISGPELQLDIAAQTAMPGPGAVSPGYNRLAAAPALIYHGETELPAAITTVIAFTPGPATAGQRPSYSHGIPLAAATPQDIR